MTETYYIYHIPGKKIGCSQSLEQRIKSQKFSEYEILEQYDCIYTASKRELQLQKQYGYKVDNIPYYLSLKRIRKAQKIGLATRNEWGPLIDWKAREEKINQKEKWDKVKSHTNYINRRIANGSEGLKKVLLQYDLDGNFIQQWDCGVRNMKKYGFEGVSGVARKRKGTIGGYQWRYKIGNKIHKKIKPFINNSFQKVIQKDLEGNIIKIWDNQQQAADTMGCSIQLISRVCRGIGKTAKGYIWERYA
jgi:hypothetical protein